MVEERKKSGAVIAKIRQVLEENSDSQTKAIGQTFFKEKVNSYGVKTAIVTKTAKACFREIRGIGKAGIFELCEQLWQSGYMEESFVACNWSYSIRDDYEPDDFLVFERWANKYVSNWAACDTLCNHTIAAFVERYPEYVGELKRWSKSQNRWVRRASAVTLIIPARHGRFLRDIFEIADNLLLDSDDLVQKGYGWMLKAASEAHQREVFEYVMKNKARMPRTALRYAIEKMGKDRKAKAMAR